VVHHAYRFAPGTVVVAPPPAGSASDFVQGYVSLALMRWALPFLGLVSGYLFFRRLTPSLAGFLVKLRTRARTVLVPFVIWSGLGVLFAVAVTSSPYRDVSAYWTVHSISEALDRWLVHPVLYPLWFLQALVGLHAALAARVPRSADVARVGAGDRRRLVGTGLAAGGAQPVDQRHRLPPVHRGFDDRHFGLAGAVGGAEGGAGFAHRRPCWPPGWGSTR